VEKTDILYLNLEDDRLDTTQSGFLDRVLETFYRFNPEAREKTSHIFLDEIQVVPGWERFIRRVLDTENTRLLLSGSSAKMLSTEVASVLRGRGISVEVLPFSFGESLHHAGIPIPVSWPPGAAQRTRLQAHFLRYLDVGGFPEVQDIDERDRIRVLQDYVELVLLRDIVERHGIENSTATRFFARRLLQSSARLFSINRVYNEFRSQAVSVSKNTLHALLDYFEDAFLVFPVSIFRKSLKARQVNPRKIYAIDPGLVRAMSFVTAVDRGARLENMVYLELRRRLDWVFEGALSYYVTATGKEVDFVLGDPVDGRVERLIQVCTSLADPATRERELNAVHEAMRELGVDEAEVVTLEDEETIALEGGRVDVFPAWRWILEKL
jgi:predicted AAA+ superfamily ATPase